MSSSNDRLVIGLTGSFGSGCSTLKESLSKLGFTPFSLSHYVKLAWTKKTGKPIEQALRPELQDVGNKLRERNRDHHLAELATKEALGKVKNSLTQMS